jgi:hypothetical protein
VYGELFETDRDHHHIERALGHTLEPAVMRKSAGWIAFVTNGAGGYWLDILPHYQDAISTSRISIDTLVQELYHGDPLRHRAVAAAEALEKVAP